MSKCLELSLYVGNVVYCNESIWYRKRKSNKIHMNEIRNAQLSDIIILQFKLKL